MITHRFRTHRVVCTLLLLAVGIACGSATEASVVEKPSRTAPALPDAAAPGPSLLDAGANPDRNAPSGPAVFRVGFAEDDISETRLVSMAGYGTYLGLPESTRRNTSGTHDPLFVSAVAILDVSSPVGVAFASVDCVGLSSVSIGRIRAEVAKRTNIAGVELIISATHDHSAPDTMGLWGALPYFTGRDGEYMNKMEGKVAGVLVKAVSEVRRARLLIAETSKPNTSTAAVDPKRRDDGVVALLAKDETSNAVLGTLTQWAAHPTVLAGNNNALSADYVGPFRKAMTQQFGGVHVYVNGALGALYATGTDAPVADPFASGARDPDVVDGYEKMAAIGTDLFNRTKTALAAAVPLLNGSVGSQTIPLGLNVDNDKFRFAATGLLGGGPVVETPLMDGKVVTTLSYFHIGELAGVTVPGEMFASGTRQLRDLLSARGFTHVAVVGLGHDWFGYLMAPDEFDDEAFAYNRDLSPSRDAMTRIIDAYRPVFASVTAPK
jgi:hypothetical protein